MTQKLIGGALVFIGCAGVGFMKARQLSSEEALLSDTVLLLNRMENELSCRRTTLSDLCELACDCKKELKHLYMELSQLLSQQTLADASACMNHALKQVNLPKSVADLHIRLGQTMGKFDMVGQLRELQVVRKSAEQQLSVIRQEQKDKRRSYQTLGLCAGAALVILLV